MSSPKRRRIQRLCVLALWSVQISRAFVPQQPHVTRSSTPLFSSTSSYVATCIPGLATVLAQELDQFGCQQVETTGESAVRFVATVETSLTTLLHVRTAHKIMECLCQGSGLRDRDDHVDVRDLLGDGKGGLLTLSVNVKLNNPSHIPSDINHSHYSALCIKNALCDSVRDIRGDRPNIELEDTDVPLTAVLVGVAGDETADISLFRQLHVGSLHRRGYRQGAIHKAAMKESLAAGLLLHAKWDQQCRSEKNVVLMDPMAGSGTFLTEAAMIAADMAPGLMRIKCRLPGQTMPCIVRWKHAPEEGDVAGKWKQLLLDATTRTKTGLQRLQESHTIRLLGNEIHSGALDLLDESLHHAGLSSVIQVQKGNCYDWRPASNDPSLSSAAWFVVTNPPWGERLTDDMHESWEDLRVFLRETCPPGTEAWTLSGNAAATKHLGLARSASVSLKTGTQSLRWLQYIIREPGAKLAERVAQPRVSNDVSSGESTFRREDRRHTPSPPKKLVKPNARPARAPREAKRAGSNDWI